ncbi:MULTISPECIES: hypothetical protein [Chloroflexus]|uniref:hypothetical protein n=1 Tax=Chloroflexus TaxID=1107 RepID=UPI001F5EF112|nr:MULTISPECIES: hypothetical protein [Chloroflexus]
MNTHFPTWTGFLKRKPDYDLWFYLIAKKGVTTLAVKGPDISRRHKEYVYGIYLPEVIADVHEYLDLVFAGIGQVLAGFGVSADAVAQMKQECKAKLGLNAAS